jgi:aspartyl-tRNA(Asn)/glutamyl-tRNA(Gln) amidotransferase subunit C
MALTEAEVRHVARLADLTLSDAEVVRMVQDLGVILRHIEQLRELDTSMVAPTTAIGVARAPLRDDQVQPGLSQTQALACAPESDGGGFSVPRFVDDA